MKIVTNTLENIAGVGIYPVIGLLLFFTLFVVLIIFVMKLSKRDVEEYGRLPLSDGDEMSENKDDSLNL
ncbi:MAG: cbb3-type cytochrome c oxidase subunit 3 [Bacteroidales bacterium]|nr:cbb3-type cytochrome c oxidase subunit 3 [Bacteroidales bacterium]